MNNTNNDEMNVIRVACHEIISPVWSVTEQVFSRHKPIFSNDGMPIHAGIRFDPTVEQWTVYFLLYDQPYYFAVVISKYPTFCVQSVYIEANIRITLKITSKTSTLENTVFFARIAPFMSKSRMSRNENEDLDENTWIFEHQKEIPGSFNDKLESLVSCLGDIGFISAEVSPECNLVLSVYYQAYWAWPGGLHIDKYTIKKLFDFGIALDVDIYTTGPDVCFPSKDVL